MGGVGALEILEGIEVEPDQELQGGEKLAGLQIVIWIGAFKANDRKHPHPPDYNMDGQIAALKEALNQTPSNVWIWGGYFLNLFKVSERVDMSFSTYLVTKVGKNAATTWLSPWARVMKEISLAGKQGNKAESFAKHSAVR